MEGLWFGCGIIAVWFVLIPLWAAKIFYEEDEPGWGLMSILAGVCGFGPLFLLGAFMLKLSRRSWFFVE